MTINRPHNSIETRRRALGLSRQEFADKLGVSRRTVEAWELTKQKPHPTVMRMINKILGD